MTSLKDDPQLGSTIAFNKIDCLTTTRNFKPVECRTAEELLDKLHKTLLESKRPQVRAKYIYRGQADHTWSLIPVAFRRNISLANENGSCSLDAPDLSNADKQVSAEFCALFEFLILADKVGLDAPVDHKWIRTWNPFAEPVNQYKVMAEWPQEELLEALALAQHHGVPTRLLDFSYDPYVAAYFAAEKSESRGEQVAVWSLDLELITWGARREKKQLEIVTVPAIRNRYLAAQKALFLLDRELSFEVQMLEETLSRHMKRWECSRAIEPGKYVLQKYCLPSSKCGRLLRLLRNLGYDRVHLMPSFDGVVRKLKAGQRQRAKTKSYP